MFGASVPEIAVADLPADPYLLDVREIGEWEMAHAPDVVLVPMSVLPGRVDEIPRDRTVYVLCHSGGRSAQVAQWLNHQGYDAVNVIGGMLAWAHSGRPVVSGS